MQKLAIITVVLIALLMAVSYIRTVQAGAPTNYRKASERAFQKAHHQGQMEYRLNDGTRVDDLTRTHAIEYDFANKWAEAVGQSLHYARLTRRRAGVVLILRSEGDLKKVENITALKLPITVWTVRNLKEAPRRRN